MIQSPIENVYEKRKAFCTETMRTLFSVSQKIEYGTHDSLTLTVVYVHPFLIYCGQDMLTAGPLRICRPILYELILCVL